MKSENQGVIRALPPEPQRNELPGNSSCPHRPKHFQVYFFAKSILDKLYYNNALNLGSPTLLLPPGDPATYGIAATARF
jgi:hypothetical protein